MRKTISLICSHTASHILQNAVRTLITFAYTFNVPFYSFLAPTNKHILTRHANIILKQFISRRIYGFIFTIENGTPMCVLLHHHTNAYFLLEFPVRVYTLTPHKQLTLPAITYNIYIFMCVYNKYSHLWKKKQNLPTLQRIKVFRAINFMFLSHSYIYMRWWTGSGVQPVA